MAEWAKEAPGVEVPVYRPRRDGRKRWEYHGKLDPEFRVDLDSLEAAHREELLDLSPWMEARQHWGGRKHQFRFIWRDEEGRREQKRSRNLLVEGRPLPRR
jgi:hypothetical protein